MAKHIFLTGEKRVGKSTIIQLLLAEKQVKAGGFRTIRTDTVFPGRGSLHLLRMDRNECPSQENLISCNLLEKDTRCAEMFDKLGCAAIAETHNADIFVMDELGPRELEAKQFTASVMQMLDGDIPILGVIQKADSPFLEQIANHPKVQVVYITLEYRDAVLQQLVQTEI